MHLKRPAAAGLAFCLFHSASYFTNKYVLSILKFTYPTLFQGWQTLLGGFLLHISWKIGWVEISSCSSTESYSYIMGTGFMLFFTIAFYMAIMEMPTFQRFLKLKIVVDWSEVLSWLPASAFFVGIIYSGSRALARLPIPIFLTLHNAADVIFYGVEASVQKEQTSVLKACRVLILLVAAGCLPLYDPQFDANGYFWALVHLFCVAVYKVFQMLRRPNSLSISEQQYINYAFSVVMLAFASHPTGDLVSALEFPFLYFYSFHSSCFASGLLGFLLTLHTMKLKSNSSSGQDIAWDFLAKAITAGLSPFFFEIAVNVPTACCLLLGGLAEVLLLYTEKAGP